MDEVEAGGQPDLREYLQILRRRLLVVVLTVIVVVGVALAYSFVKKPTYTATATVLVPQQQAASALNIQNSQLQDPSALQRSLADDQQFAQGDAVKTAARQALGYKADVSIGTSTTADVLTFTASSGDQQAAADVANAYAKAYITARRANQIDQYTQQVTALQASISKLQAQAAALAPNDPQRAALEQSISTLTQSVEQTQAASQLASQVGPTVVNAALPPKSPSSPKPLRNGILGVVVGVLLGIGLAFLAERLDDGINSREAAERASDGQPVVGLLPLVDSWKGKDEHHVALMEDSSSTVAEAYRTLRTSVQFLGIDEPKRVIGITSSVPGEGKSTAVANLAVAFARAGQRVVVVSCDLRRPRAHDFFGLDNSVGLTSVLIGQASLADALRPVDGEPRLRVVASGPVPPNPAEILSLDRVREVVDLVADKSDVVLLDCPPVLPVTDTLLLSRLVDGMLVLASTKTTSTRDLRRTFEMLRQVQTPLMGLVLNRVPTSGSSAYGYGYGYGSHEYPQPAVAPAVRESEPATPLARRQPSPVASRQGPLSQPMERTQAGTSSATHHPRSEASNSTDAQSPTKESVPPRLESTNFPAPQLGESQSVPSIPAYRETDDLG